MTPPARPPAVAGLFYPADPAVLCRTVDDLLAAVPPSEEPLARAYVVPHAGYRYSGITAAYVYAHLGRCAHAVRRIVLIGPSHRRPLRGVAVPAASSWHTPLGPVEIDVDGAAALVASGLAVADDAVHAEEHSIEVQLPFLQRVLPERPPILPIAVGLSSASEVATVIAAALSAGPGEAIVLCSTDLSHYLEDTAARQRDEATISAVLRLDADAIGPADACGRHPLRGLVHWAAGIGLHGHLHDYRTSAQAGADPSRVVGYAALALSPPEP
ncbi:MAG TPA: AmmeMemoRadiSam system protein B [Micromonosporaceae bacterium]|nr:AmmeMemoRadiSam system protein B [Micromonosporaceae bacterium]